MIPIKDSVICRIYKYVLQQHPSSDFYMNYKNKWSNYQNKWDQTSRKPCQRTSVQKEIQQITIIKPPLCFLHRYPIPCTLIESYAPYGFRSNTGNSFQMRPHVRNALPHSSSSFKRSKHGSWPQLWQHYNVRDALLDRKDLSDLGIHKLIPTGILGRKKPIQNCLTEEMPVNKYTLLKQIKYK